jgi:hypothetical protein
MKSLSRWLAIAAIAAYANPVVAQNATAFKDSTGRVFLYGLQPNSKVSVGITGDFSKTIQANSCGLVVVRPTSSFALGTFQIDGQTINSTSVNNVLSMSTDCTQMGSYPGVFKTATGGIAIKKTPSTDYTLTFPNHKATRLVLVNSCGYVVLKNVNITSLNLPTVTGGRADFAYASLPVAQPLACAKGVLYFAKGFDVKTAIASATTSASTTTSTTTTTSTQQTTGSTSTISAQTAQPVATKSGNYLVISSIPPGTYTVANAANLTQAKVFTVTSKGCLVGDRTQIGSPSKFLVSRQGLTFPIDWVSLSTVSVVPSC